MTRDATSSHTPTPGFVHEALMYRSEAERAEAVREFVMEAAVADEPVLVALPHEGLEQLREALGEETEALRFADMRDVGRNPSRLTGLIEEWVDEHEGPARVVSEALWPGRTYAETAECLRHEARLNQSLADADATILCPYDAENLDRATLDGAELTHPVVVEGGRRRPSSAYHGEVERELADRWPLEAPSGPVHEHGLGPADLPTVTDLRHAVAEDPFLTALRQDRREDLILAVNEAATNAVQHGDGVCTARVWHDGHGVVTEVSSSAAGDPLPARHARPTPAAVSGRGLWLINQVCDLVELRSGEDRVTLRMHMSDE